ncbi:MAG: hypothetical protein E7379_03595 [Clostridiales bacterium]|nr:hypothetical protein [Clostridiales bacterium]
MEKERLEILCEILSELLNDLSYEMTKEYVDKAEKAINLFVECYIQPELKGLDKLPTINFDQRKLDLSDESSTICLGRTKNNKVTLNTGVFYNTEERMVEEYDAKCYDTTFADENAIEQKYQENYKKNFMAVRNQTLIDFIIAVAHEMRHLFQYRYDFHRRHHDSVKRQLYKNLIGNNADEIVRDIDDCDQDALWLMIESLKMKYGETIAQLNDIYTDDGGFVLYSKSLLEKDARRYSMKKILEFKKDLLSLWKEGKCEEEVIDQMQCLKQQEKSYSLLDIKEIRSMLMFEFCLCFQEELENIEEEKEFDEWFDEKRKTLTINDVVYVLSRLVEYDKNAKFCVSEDTVEILRHFLNSKFIVELTNGDFQLFKNRLKARKLNYAVKIMNAWERNEFDDNVYMVQK